MLNQYALVEMEGLILK